VAGFGAELLCFSQGPPPLGDGCGQVTGMNRTLGCSLLLMLSSMAMVAQQADPREGKLLILERMWNEAQVNRDAPALDALVAERFVNTEYDGEFSDKTKFLADIRDPLFRPSSVNIQDVKVTLYGETAVGARALDGWTTTLPHALRGKEGSAVPDAAFYEQWATSPFADTYLTKLAEAAVDSLGLGKSGTTDFLGVSYSSVDYVGHTFGPRSWEIQDILVRLDQDLGEFFGFLDKKVGAGNYVVALSADHGVAPIPVDMQKTGVDAGVLSLPELQARIEKALEPLNYTKPVVARMAGNEVYFSEGVYGRLKADPAAMKVVLDAISTMPGVAAVYRAEELGNGTTPIAQTRKAAVLSYFAGRSGDLYVLQKPYWLMDSSPEGSKRVTGTGHGTPYNYDQHVPVFFMGFGIQPGEYFEPATPADIAPTLAALTGITLATRDGRVLAEALRKPTKKD